MITKSSWQKISYSSASLKGKKILFANFPADGHFNPMTGLAHHLKQLGCDVRWYTSRMYKEKIERLGIKHYPFVKGLEIVNDDIDSTFPERTRIKGQISKLKFDIINAFILRGPEYLDDVSEIQKVFPFDLMVADCAFSGTPFIAGKLNVPVVSVGVLPLTEPSKDLPPVGLGMTPSYTFFGKLKQAVLRAVTDRFIFREPNKVLWRLLDKYGITHNNESAFNMILKKSSLLLQSGTPNFEYRRSDFGDYVRFVGALLPYSAGEQKTSWYDPRLNQYSKLVLVTQGTVERDVEKLLVPTIEAFKGSDTLVVATTGGSGTKELRERYSESNIIIEDFIPFSDVMPYMDVYITNGGYGGVMLGLENELPMIVAGVHEGKNEINARIGYFGLGINLKTELPTPKQIKDAFIKIQNDGSFKTNVVRLAKEFRSYHPNEMSAQYIAELLFLKGSLPIGRLEEGVY